MRQATARFLHMSSAGFDLDRLLRLEAHRVASQLSDQFAVEEQSISGKGKGLRTQGQHVPLAIVNVRLQGGTWGFRLFKGSWRFS